MTKEELTKKIDILYKEANRLEFLYKMKGNSRILEEKKRCLRKARTLILERGKLN